MFIVVTLEF